MTSTYNRNLRVYINQYTIDNPHCTIVKVAFFRKCESLFKSPKKIFQKTILNLKFKIPAHNSIILWAGILNFKFRIVVWNILFWKLGDLKNESHSLKKSHLQYVLSISTLILAYKSFMKVFRAISIFIRSYKMGNCFQYYK